MRKHESASDATEAMLALNGSEETMDTRLNRRTLVKTAAAGTMGLSTAPFYFRKASAATEIQFWTPAIDEIGGPIITKLVDEFNATVGPENGITVKMVGVPDLTKYTTAMTTADAPDVVMTYSYDPVIPWIANDFLQPMDEYFAELGLLEEDFYQVPWTMLSFQGHTWGLMQEYDMTEFWWNTALHPDGPPATIAELDALAADYTQFDSDGNLTQVGLIPWAQGGHIPGGYATWGTIMNARFYDHEQRKWTINTPENTAFLDWYLTYVDLFGGREKADVLISSVPKATFGGDVLYFGKAVFGAEHEFFPIVVDTMGVPDTYDLAHPPIIPDVTIGETTMVDAANLFLMPARARHPREAAIFAKHMVSQTSLVAWAEPIGQMLPTIAAQNDPGLNAAQPWLKIFTETVEAGKLLPPPLSPHAVIFTNALTLAIDEVTYRQKSPAEALAGVETAVMQAVEEFKIAHPDWEGE